MMSDSRRSSAAVALVAAALGWSLAPVFIRGLSGVYTPCAQNFLRYGGGAAPLVVISMVAYRDDLRVVLRNYRGMVAIAALNVVQQSLWTIGCTGAGATMAQLTSKLSVVLVIIFSFLLFREERPVIRSPLYLIGTLMGLVGVAGVISRDAGSLVPVFDFPLVALLLVAVLWGLYTVWGKHLVTHVHPVPMFTVLAVYTTIAFGILMLVLDGPSVVIDGGPRLALLAVLSGVVPIAMAHTCFHFAQKHLGSALSASILLLNPLVTYAIALAFWSDERLILTQWLGAVVLLIGAFLVTYAGHRVHRSRARQDEG